MGLLPTPDGLPSMIIQCTSCQTRFRVPDDKVGDKPVKVRCSKCKAVFPVTKAQGVPEATSNAGAAVPAAAAAARPPSGSAARAGKSSGISGAQAAVKSSGTSGANPAARPKAYSGLGVTLPSKMPPADPFAAFDPAGEPIGEPTTPFLYHAGINATRAPPNEPDVTKPGVDVRALQASRQFEPPPPTTLNEFQAPPDPFASLDLGSFGAAPLAAPAPPAPLPHTESDPFANLELSSPGVKATAAALVSSSSSSDPFGALPLVAPPPAAAAPLPQAESDPFARLDLAMPAAAVPAPAPKVDADPFAHFSMPAAPASPAAPSFASAPAATVPEADPFANLDLGALVAKSGPAPTPKPPPLPGGAAPAAEASTHVGPTPSAPEPARAASAPAVAPGGSPLDDFFGDAGQTSMPASSFGPAGGYDSGSGGADGDEAHHDGGTLGAAVDRSLFDLPPPPPPTAQTAIPASEPLEMVGERAVPRPKVKAPEAKTSAPPPPSRGAQLVSTFFNTLLVGAVAWGSLVGVATFRNDGHFDAALVRPRELYRTLFKGAATAAGRLQVEDVTNGMYVTASGRSVFYVRGVVANQGKTPLGPASLTVEVVEGDKVLSTGIGWVGAETTPETLFVLSDAASLKSLVKQQQADAKPVPPGGTMPVVVVLMDYPDDLASRSLRMTVDVPTVVAAK